LPIALLPSPHRHRFPLPCCIPYDVPALKTLHQETDFRHGLLGLFFCVFAYWLRRRRRMEARSFAVMCVLGTGVYFAHLGAIAVLGACCCTVAAADWRERGRRLKLALELGWLACPALLLVLGFLRGNGRVGQLVWADWGRKLWQLFSVVQLHELGLEAGVVLGVGMCLAGLVRQARVQRELAAAGVVLLTCYAVLPSTLFTSQYADVRLIAPACVLLLIALRPRRKRMQAVALAGLMLLLGERVLLIAQDWMTGDQHTRAALAMGTGLPPGARIDVLAPLPPAFAPRLAPHDYTLSKAIDYWTIERGAYESNVFATAGQQPLIQRPELATCWPGERRGCLAAFDYVWTDKAVARLPAGAVLAPRWGRIRLWKLFRPGQVNRPGSNASAAR
ncbi:MAG: hypothetical protein ACRD04_14115, partial [Terriglobales bacterium]